MGARTLRTIKNTFTSGELDPLLVRRTDLRHYYNGADRLRNVVVLPQGGVRRRPGTRHVDRCWPQLERVTAADYTTPNGGDPADLNDNDTSTTSDTNVDIGTTNPYVVLHVDLGQARTIYAVDVKDLILISGSSTASSTQFKIQYSTDNAVWVDFGPGLGTVTNLNGAFPSPISRRRSGTNRQQATARYWRLARVGSADLATSKVRVSEFNIYRASSTPHTPSQGRVIEFEVANNFFYCCLATDQNLAIYLNDVWQTDVFIPHVSSILDEINWTQSQDTLLIFHPAVETTRVLREGADTIWGSYQVNWTRMPVYRFSDTPQPGTISITPGATTGNTTLTAGSPFWTIDMVGWYVYSALRAGQARITAFTSSTVVQVEVLDDFTNTTAFTDGLVRELAFANDRGWPSCGTFHEERLWLAGSAQAPQTLFASKVGAYFDFNDAQALDDYGMVFDLATDKVSAIYNIISGRHLQILTSSAEFYVLPNDDPITPNSLTVKRTTETGSSGPGVRWAAVEGATMFIQRGGHSLREFVFSDTEQAYKALNISLLSSHLLSSPTQLTHRPGTETDEADWVLVLNGDGTIAVLCTLRDQEVTAWSKWQLSTSVRSVGVVDTDVYAVVIADVGGVEERHLVKFITDVTTFTDNGLSFTGNQALTYSATLGQTLFSYTATSPSDANAVKVVQNGVMLNYPTEYTVNLGAKTISLVVPAAAGDQVTIYVGIIQATGLAHLENQVVALIIDGAFEGTGVVDNGVVDLPTPALGSYEIGLRWPDVVGAGLNEEVWVRDMPVDLELPDGSTVGRKKRIVEMTLAVDNSGSMMAGANGEQRWPVTPRRFDTTTDLLSAAEPAFTGDINLEAILGFDDYGQAEVTLREPGPLTLLAISKTVSI